MPPRRVRGLPDAVAWRFTVGWSACSAITSVRFRGGAPRGFCGSIYIERNRTQPGPVNAPDWRPCRGSVGSLPSLASAPFPTRLHSSRSRTAGLCRPSTRATQRSGQAALLDDLIKPHRQIIASALIHRGISVSEEQEWQSDYVWIGKEMGAQITKCRIRKVSFKHDDKVIVAEVRMPNPYNGVPLREVYVGVSGGCFLLCGGTITIAPMDSFVEEY